MNSTFGILLIIAIIALFVSGRSGWAWALIVIVLLIILSRGYGPPPPYPYQ
jgi:hypothetical protein